MKKFTKEDDEFKIMMECWAFYQRNYAPISEKDWETAITEARTIGLKYKSNLAKRIVLAFIQDIEERNANYE